MQAHRQIHGQVYVQTRGPSDRHSDRRQIDRRTDPPDPSGLYQCSCTCVSASCGSLLSFIFSWSHCNFLVVWLLTWPGASLNGASSDVPVVEVPTRTHSSGDHDLFPRKRTRKPGHPPCGGSLWRRAGSVSTYREGCGWANQSWVGDFRATRARIRSRGLTCQ